MRSNYFHRSGGRGGSKVGERYRGSGAFWKRVLEDAHSRESIQACGGGKGPGTVRARLGPGAKSGTGVEVRFEVAEKGRRAVWRAESVELLSLRSGSRSIWAVEAPSQATGGAGRVYLPMAVEEPVYRMRVELSRIAGFDASELWEVPGVVLPGVGGCVEGPGEAAAIDGARVRVHSLTAPGGTVPGALREFWNQWTSEGHAFTLWVEVAPGEADRRLTLVGAVDEAGRKAEVEAGMWSGDHYAFGLVPAPGARALSFTFALHRSRVVEVVVDTRAWSGN